MCFKRRFEGDFNAIVSFLLTCKSAEGMHWLSAPPCFKFHDIM